MSVPTDPGFSSLRRSLYDGSDPILPAAATVQRIPTGLPSMTGSGYYQELVTPTQDLMDFQDSTGIRLPPPVGHRSTAAPVSQWRLDQSVTGQPSSYVFLCALLFCRDVSFSGSSIDSQSGNFVEVSMAERNIPADIWDAYRSGSLATSPKAAKHWVLQHENHVRSHMRHYRQQSEGPVATLPGPFSFARLPESYLDQFRQGH
jgi:hypothetical protein